MVDCQVITITLQLEFIQSNEQLIKGDRLYDKTRPELISYFGEPLKIFETLDLTGVASHYVFNNSKLHIVSYSFHDKMKKLDKKIFMQKLELIKKSLNNDYGYKLKHEKCNFDTYLVKPTNYLLN